MSMIQHIRRYPLPTLWTISTIRLDWNCLNRLFAQLYLRNECGVRRAYFHYRGCFISSFVDLSGFQPL